MPFAVGADVVVLSLRKTGRVVDAARNGRYRVRVGGVVMQCREEELQEARAEKKTRRRRPLGNDTGGTTLHSAPGFISHPTIEKPRHALADARHQLASLDLHGLTVEEALRKVEERIDLALRAGLDSLEIIHGRSSGRIKVAVHRLLAELTAVRHFDVIPENPGATRVYF